MKLRLLFVPLALAAVAAAYVSLHPGVAVAAPRFDTSQPTPVTKAASYTIDTNHAGVYFEIRHLGLSNVTGRFNTFSGKVSFDPGDLANSRADFTAQATSIDTGIAARDEHLRTADFFDVAKYPTMTFKSTKFEKKGQGYVVTGDLTIKGKTKSVAIPFKHYGPVTFNFDGPSTHMGFIADPVVIKRTDFGIGDLTRMPNGELGASNEVTVRISFEAIQDK